MHSNVPLDYAVFQLSPRRSRCELFVSYDGTTEKLASGLVKPFVTHLKVAEEQVALAGKSIKLDVDRYKNAETWFTKGTLERFVRFVSTPEVLEMVNTFDAEMSQLEVARKIYSQGAADHESGTSGEIGNGATATSDVTKKELLRAIDVRLSAVKQDLSTACHRASAAGFNPETVSELQFFADHFGSHRLSDACSKFITLTHRRPDLFNSGNNTTSTWKVSSDSVLRSSASSDMSLDDPSDDHLKPSMCTTAKVILPSQHFSRESSPGPSPIDAVDERESIKDKDIDKNKAMESTTSDTTSVSESASMSAGKPQLTRRLSVQERISLFENKAQNSPSSSATTPTSTGGKPELRRLSSDVNSSSDKAVWKRWSGASDMSIDVSGERKEPDSNVSTPTPSASSSRPLFPPKFKDPIEPKSEEGDKDSKPSVRVKFGESRLEEPESSESNSTSPSFSGRLSEKDQSCGGGVRSRAASFGRAEDFGLENPSTSSPVQIKCRRGKIEQFCSPIQSAMEEKLDGLSGEGRKSQEETTEVHLQPEIQNIRVEDDPVPAQPKWRSFSEVKKAGGNFFETTENQNESNSLHMETSDLFGGRNQVTWRGGGKDSSSKVGGGQMGLTGKTTLNDHEALSSTPSVSIDQVQRVRQAKGNQGVNDELKMKANELEKLFAEHKLRIPGDHSNSAWRIRPAAVAKEVGKPAGDSSEMEMFNSTPLSKSVDIHDNDVTPKQNIYSLSILDDSRGKLYQKYMQKRDVKLREDWSLNRSEKEAQMKAMHVSLEKSRAEMKVKLAGSTEKRNSAKMRSFNVRSTAKRAQPIDPFVSDEDEGQAEYVGKKLTETYLGDSSSKSSQGKKVQLNKNASSPATRNSTAPIPRSSGKASNSSTGRRRLPYDNPLAQSVPNFSDLRKENTRPSSGGSKPVRPQGRNHARKKSTCEDLPLANEEKPRRFQMLRKSMATTMEMNDSRNSDDVDDAQFRPSKFHREKNEDFDKFSDIGISKASVMGEAARNGYCFGDTNFGMDEMMDVAKDEEHDYETTVMEESTYIDNSKGRLSHESDKSGNSGYENNNALTFGSQAELPISMSSLFRSMGSTLDSPSESTGSWNVRLQNPFAYSHEISDIDAVDSPIGSPASWNFQSLSQSEAEAARIRKKWGETQKPIDDIDTSHGHSQSRKDVTSGLKRFLKFGRKNRASESMADWISATTSEGDDSEDGRDLAHRSAEDLGKSRMGFSQSRNSDERFNESDLFNDQVQALRSSIPTRPSNFKFRESHLSGSSLKGPKSFFSLSNFRNKGNDSKPR